MLTRIVRAALRYRLVVLLAVAGLAAVQIARLPAADYAIFPQFVAPTVTVETAAPGFGPGTTEAAVTDRLERAFAGLPGLAVMRSTSQFGLSMVHLIFHGGTDPYRDRSLVTGRLAAFDSTLPKGVVPLVAPMQSAAGNVLSIGLTSRKLSLSRLTAIADTVLRPALRAVPGVADVVVYGAAAPRLDIEVTPQTLYADGISLGAMAHAARQASAVIGGGFVDTGNQRLHLQVHAQALAAATLGRSLLAMRHGAPISLADVARIRRSGPPPIGAAMVGPHRGLLLIVSALYGANALAVADGAAHVVKHLTPTLNAEGVTVDPHAFAPATFIRTALRDLGHVLLIGAGLILLVLLLALRDWRVALISFVSIPISLLAAVATLAALGLSLSTMALAGLAIALGEVVDDAVVDIENIGRRLRENRAAARPEPPLRVILRASIEVRSAVIFATFCVAIAFTPVLALGGVAGRLFAPLGVAYVAAILASLVVALTLTPALAAILLAGRDARAMRDPPIAALRPAYVRALAASRRAAPALFGLGLAAIVAAAASLPLLSPRFLPSFRENNVIIHDRAAPGTSLATMLTVGQRTMDILAHSKLVADAVMHVGRATLSNDHSTVNDQEFDVTLSKAGNRDPRRSDAALMRAVGGIDGLAWWSNSFLTERIDESLSGVTAPIKISVFGPRRAAIDGDARRNAAAIGTLPGVTDASVAAPATVPALMIDLDRAAMLRHGVTTTTALHAMQTAYAGRTVGQIYKGMLTEPIVLTLPPALRRDPRAIAALPVAGADGALVPFGRIASIHQGTEAARILHQDGRRVQDVTVQAVPGTATQVLARIRKRIRKLGLAAGDYVTYGGTAVAGDAARRSLLIHGVMALAGIIALLALALGDARAVALLIATLPVGLAGGIAAVWIVLGGHLGLGAMVGLVTLFGITLRNGLLLLIHTRRLVREEGAPWTAETARRAASERLPAILITATVTALGLLPLALATGSPGDAIEGPMAIVILGGLITASASNLFLLPNAAARLLRIGPRRDDGLD